MNDVRVGQDDPTAAGGEAPRRRQVWRRAGGVMACVVAILLAAVAIGMAVGWAYARLMGDGVAGLKPAGHLEALLTARVAVFLLAFQTVTIILTFFAARWFAPAGKTLLPTRWPRLGLKAIVGVVVLFFGLLAIVSAAIMAFDPQLFANDVNPFAEMMQARTWWMMLIAAAIGAPLAEELLFRGLMFGVLRETPLGFPGATVISSMAWAILHLQYSAIAIALIVVMGFYFAWLREKTGSILPSMICHGLYNGAIVLALAFTAGSPLQPG